MKVHVLDRNRADALPYEYLATGHGGWTYGRFMVRANVFSFVPQLAQCNRCRSRLPPGASRDRNGDTIRHLHATDEQITAVEVSLLRIARVWT